MTAIQDSEAAFLARLGQRVRTLRALRGMSRKVLAKVSGVSERYIAQLESGLGNISVVLLLRLAAAMGGKLDDLLRTEESSPDAQILRDMLASATPEQLLQARVILSGNQPALRPARTSGPINRIALIGLRGAGKSTLGKLLAEQLGWPFHELNRELEAANSLSISEIMALYGQEGFRRLEQNALRSLIERPGPMVLATGGGIVSEPLTFDMVLTSFYTVWIKAKPEEHMSRVRKQGDLRPMADDRSAMAELRTILLSRTPLYARADVTVDTSGASIANASRALMALVREKLPMPEPAREGA